MLHFAEDELMTLMIEAAHFFVKNQTKSTLITPSNMYVFTERLIRDLEAVFDKCCSENVSLFSVFTNSKQVCAPDCSRVVKQVFSTICVCSTTAPATRRTS